MERYAQSETYYPQYQEGGAANATGVEFSIIRLSDGYWWDFTAAAFQDAYDADSLESMTEDDAGGNGLWNYQVGWAIPDANAQYRVRFKVTDPNGSFYRMGPKIIVNSGLLDVMADLVDGGRLDLLVDGIKAKTDNLPTDPADDSDIDSQLATITAYVDDLESRLTAARAGYLDNLSGGAVALEATVGALNNISVADIIAGIADGSYDLQEMMRIMFSALCLITSGGGTNTLKSRDSADTKDRITATVDENGNRTNVVLDGS